VKTLKFATCLLLLAIGISVLAQSKSANVAHVDMITIAGSINPAVDDFIRESIGRAKTNRARALIIQLDTPGGLVDSTRTIVKEMLAAPVPIIVYVAPSGARAGSAGVFITMAAHVAVMAPATNIGAAHPVAGGGQEVKGDGTKDRERYRRVQRSHRTKTRAQC
jgi:membrane-bound serine protease (ClpP class)